MSYTAIAALLAAALLSYSFLKGCIIMSESLKTAEEALSRAVAQVVTDVSAGLQAISDSIADRVANGTAAADIQAQADKLNALDTSVLAAEKPPAPPPPPAPFTITSTALADGVVGTAYSAPITFSGGVAPFAVTSIPTSANGLTVGLDGVVSGTPTSVGDVAFAVTASDTSAPPQVVTGTVTVHSA